MPRFAIATAFFLAAAGLLVSSPVQAKKCKPPLVCPTKSASKCKPPLVCPKKRAPKRCKAPRVSCGGKCQYPEECPRRARSCPYGTKRGAETKGLCCWPGQMSDGKKCIGSPVSCPEGVEKSVEKQACVSKGCPEGKTWLPGDHCCYPGSKWSKRKKACVGPKTCRPGEMRRGLECVPPGSFTDAERREVDDRLVLPREQPEQQHVQRGGEVGVEQEGLGDVHRVEVVARRAEVGQPHLVATLEVELGGEELHAPVAAGLSLQLACRKVHSLTKRA